jgi:hypothetical protein
LCAAGDGHFERLGKTWRVQHAACAIEFRGQPDEARDAEFLRQLTIRASMTGKRGNRARATLKAREVKP